MSQERQKTPAYSPWSSLFWIFSMIDISAVFAEKAKLKFIKAVVFLWEFDKLNMYSFFNNFVDIGKKKDRSVVVVWSLNSFLKIGTTFSILQMLGKTPDVKDLFINLQTYTFQNFER